MSLQTLALERKLQLFLLIISVSWLSCKQTPTKPVKEQPAVDTTIKTLSHQQQPKVKQDTTPVYTADIYKTYIPQAVYTMLEEKLPGWKLPSPNSWEKYWFHTYEKTNAFVDYVNGDFNGDNKPDYALILENEQHAFIVWVLQSEGNSYKAIELTKLTEATLPLDTGLELIEKGELSYLSMDEGADDIKTIDLKHQAIQVSYFEASADTYY